MTRRWLYFAAWLFVTTALFGRTLLTLFRLGLEDENYSHIVLIPVISGWLLVTERERIFRRVETALRAGVGVMAAAAAIFALGWTFAGRLSTNDALVVSALSLVLLWIGGFLALFGTAAAREAKFALGFLSLTVPFPDFLLGRIIYALQVGSTVITAWLFRLTGVPVFQDGFFFFLPNVSIEVAKECSGIRSSMALLVTTLLAGHLFLRSTGKKLLLLAVGLVLMVVKNGVRIVTLTLLASYVDRAFLFGRLHTQGGVVFFLLALLLMVPVLQWLRRSELAQQPPAKPAV